MGDTPRILRIEVFILNRITEMNGKDFTMNHRMDQSQAIRQRGPNRSLQSQSGNLQYLQDRSEGLLILLIDRICGQRIERSIRRKRKCVQPSSTCVFIKVAELMNKSLASSAGKQFQSEK